jgi:hypothetical protein
MNLLRIIILLLLPNVVSAQVEIASNMGYTPLCGGFMVRLMENFNHHQAGAYVEYFRDISGHKGDKGFGLFINARQPDAKLSIYPQLCVGYTRVFEDSYATDTYIQGGFTASVYGGIAAKINEHFYVNFEAGIKATFSIVNYVLIPTTIGVTYRFKKKVKHQDEQTNKKSGE